jgi:hypothetical protein
MLTAIALLSALTAAAGGVARLAFLIKDRRRAARVADAEARRKVRELEK